MTSFKPTLEQATLAADAAAKWWADRLRESAGVVQERPASDTLGFAEESVVKAAASDFFLDRIRQQSPTTPEQCDEFQRRLRNKITEYLLSDRNHWRDIYGWDDGGPMMILSVDYGPCPTLLNSMREALVPRNMAESAGLPYKTDMWVSARRVEVRCGMYGSNLEIYGPIWGSTMIEHRECEERRYKASQEWREWRDAVFRRGERPQGYDSISPPRWQGPV